MWKQNQCVCLGPGATPELFFVLRVFLPLPCSSQLKDAQIKSMASLPCSLEALFSQSHNTT